MTGIFVWLFLARGKWQSGLPKVKRYCLEERRRTQAHVIYPQTRLVLKQHISLELESEKVPKAAKVLGQTCLPRKMCLMKWKV